jgi:hypothetical protein
MSLGGQANRFSTQYSLTRKPTVISGGGSGSIAHLVKKSCRIYGGMSQSSGTPWHKAASQETCAQYSTSNQVILVLLCSEALRMAWGSSERKPQNKLAKDANFLQYTADNDWIDPASIWHCTNRMYNTDVCDGNKVARVSIRIVFSAEITG